MTTVFKAAVIALTMTTMCLAQESLVPVHNPGNLEWPAAEVDKIYLSACSAVRKEFGANRSVGPRVTLVLGADRNHVNFETGNVFLVKWDRGLFAQGVVLLAFEHLMPVERRLTIVRRAINSADATIEVGQLGK